MLEKMAKYSNAEEWADIVPIPQDDGPGQPLAAIAYSDDYVEAMSYLRAVMANNEMSERALHLTEDIIRMNPAHYTVWLYRSRILFATSSSLPAEITWLNTIALKYQKNYQIWHHRHTIVDALNSCTGEQDFLSQMFELDMKNYHVWSYRQWLVKRFDLWEGKGELEAVESILERDVRNNSAWNHRWYLVFGRGESCFEDKERVRREVDYAKEAIHLAPQNQSPWNYIRGLIRQTKGPAALSLASFKQFASEFASLDDPDNVTSSHALDLLAEILAEREGDAADAAKALDLLAKKYDPIRENYWKYRKSLLVGQGGVKAAA
ncbi:farnesyltransferas-like protein [Tothia fuscella]|uniref:Protein farnesyltransferase/geranylgeranyltransferase type-1 subunit alpha n=1 Tax=Tothia fuscella TaxID=1048955 RepID=A0A9P4U3G9_9PEZI|nr:farnesyltransferas-like protein [Tothia fuscella]